MISLGARALPALVVFGLALSACKRESAGPSPAPAASQAPVVKPLAVSPKELKVPSTQQKFKLDGELNEPVWNALAARSRPFVDTAGLEARPYSEARFLYDADNLYVALYAADDDLRAIVMQHDGPVSTDDSFHVEITPADPAGSPTYVFDVSPAGVVADAKRAPSGKDDLAWESGIKVGVDKDGTLNNPNDMDEEWVIEAAIPLKAIGLEAKPGPRLRVAISRCDTPRGSTERRCGAWGTPDALRVLELGP